MSLRIPSWWPRPRQHVPPQSAPTAPLEETWAPPHDTYRCRVHEAGHALLLPFHPQGLHPQAVVHPGDDLFSPHVETGYLQLGPCSVFELLFDMHMALAGRAAERLLLHDVSDGSLQDILTWESLARRYLSTTDDDHVLPFIHAPTTPAEACHNATVLRDLRRVQDGIVTDFLRSNRGSLEHVAFLLLEEGPLYGAALQDQLLGVQPTFSLSESLRDRDA